MKRIAACIFTMLIGGAAGAAGYAWWQHEKNEEPENELKLYGNIDIRDAELAFNGNEHVVEVLVEEGDQVTKGQVLARLHSDRMLAQLARANAQVQAQAEVVRRLENGTRPQEIEQARARVEAAQARVRNAQLVVDRLENTTRSGASSAQDLDDARAQLDVAQADLAVRQEELDLAHEGPREEDIAEAHARLDAGRAEIALLEDQLEDATLTAPADGVIQSRVLEPGEYATPARPVFTLALLDPKWVRAYVPEPDLGKIDQGMRAAVSSDSFPDRTFNGWIGFISPTAEFTPKAVQTTDLRPRLVYEVRVFVNDPENKLRLGQPVTVEVRLNERESGSQPQRPSVPPANSNAVES